MLIGSIGAMVSLVLFLSRATHAHTGSHHPHRAERHPGRVPLGHLRPLDGQLHRERRVEEPGPRRHRARPVGVDPAPGRRPLVPLPAHRGAQREPDHRQSARRHGRDPGLHRAPPGLHRLRPGSTRPSFRSIEEHQAVVNAVAADPSAANVAAVVRAIGPANFAQLVRYETQLKTLVLPVPGPAQLPVRPPGPAPAARVGPGRLARAVAALVLGGLRRHGPLRPDHLLDQGPLEHQRGQGRPGEPTRRRWPDELAQLLDTLPEGAGAG